MIITGKRTEEKKQEPAETPAPSAPEKKEEPMVIRFILAALKDAEETVASIRSEDGAKSFTFKVKRGIVEVPAGDGQDATCRLLEKNGFKVLDMVEEDGDKKPDLGEVSPKAKYDQKIRLAHPDMTDDMKPTALFSYEVGGKDVQVSVEDGITETDDPALVRVLVEKGYRVMNPHTLETEEEKQE